MSTQDKSERTIYLGCMDFRLPGPFDCRNAGGATMALRKEIEMLFAQHPETTALDITVHRDCGGIKAAATILAGKDLSISTESLALFEEKFVKYFRGHRFEGALTDRQTMERMEEFNRDLQESQARGILKRLGREDVQVNVLLASVPTGLHADTVIVVMGELPDKDNEIAKLSGVSKGNAYVIMATTVEEVSPSLELAVKVMGKKSIVFIPSSELERKRADELCKKPYMSGIVPKIMPGYRVKIK